MAMQIGAPAGNSLKVAPPSSMARPISPGASLRGALVGKSNFNDVAPASSNTGLGVLGAMLLVTVLWTGRRRVSLAARGRKSPCGDGGQGRERAKSWRVFSTLQSYATKLVKMRGEAKSLKTRLEQVEMKAALDDAANTEMQLALEEELAYHKEAQRMLEHHFVGAQTGYNEMSFLLETTKAEHSEEFKALSNRLKRSSAAQEKAENEMKSLKTQMTRLSTACSTLLKKIKTLSAKLKSYKEENEALRNENQRLHEELAEQKVLIKELFKLQDGGEQRRQQLLAENHVLQRQLENAERQVALLLEN